MAADGKPMAGKLFHVAILNASMETPTKEAKQNDENKTTAQKTSPGNQAERKAVDENDKQPWLLKNKS